MVDDTKDKQGEAKKVSDIISGFATVFATLINTLDAKGVLTRHEFREALAQVWQEVPDEADNKEVRNVVALFLQFLQEPKKDA